MLRRCLLAVCAVLGASTAIARSAPAPSLLSFPLPPVQARAAVVLDATTGEVLGAKNPRMRLPMASTTKIMTALVALQLGHLDDRIVVPASAFDFESDATVMGLHPGQIVTLRDLLYGLLLPSGADAANTIAIHYAGSEQRFVALMNREAQVLGLHDTHYVDAHGLDSVNHYTSALDLATLGAYVSFNPTIIHITSTRSYRWDGHTLVNLNKVLFWYPGVDGIKPGYINDSGICQVLDVRRFGHHIVVALLNTPDLVTDARNLLNFGLQSFSWIQSTTPADSPFRVQTGMDGQTVYAYFPGSGHYIRGAFWRAYQALGGMSLFGFPRTEQVLESGRRVQYFQNGELALTSSGQVTRVTLGLTPLPTPIPLTPVPIPTTPPLKSGTATPVSTPAISGRPTATATPPEDGGVRPTPVRTVAPDVRGSTAPLPTSTPIPLQNVINAEDGTVTPAGTPSPALTKTGTPISETPTHTPVPPSVTSRPAVTATPHPERVSPTAFIPNPAFTAFLRAHTSVGQAASQAVWRHGFLIQVFTYGALALDPQEHITYLLPLGDRLLAARGELPPHAGNVYPSGFAPLLMMRAIGWLNTDG